MTQSEKRQLIKKLGISSYEYASWLRKQFPGKHWVEFDHPVMMAEFAKLNGRKWQGV